MTVHNHSQRLEFYLGDLHPEMQRPASALITAMRRHRFTVAGDQYVCHPFEGLRLPQRQDHLFRIEKTTKARPWQSAHQYGLALDFACRRVDQDTEALSGWFWPDSDLIWSTLKREAVAVSLDVPIKWDRGHVEHPLWFKREWNWVA